MLTTDFTPVAYSRFIHYHLGDHDVVYQPSKDSGSWNPIIVQDHAVGDYWIIDTGNEFDPGPHGPFKTQVEAWDWWQGPDVGF